MRTTLPALLALLAAASTGGCWSGQRRPLFGGATDEPTAAARLRPPPPPRPYTQTPELELIAKLREAPSADKRGQVVDELVRRGEPSRKVVRAALEEELVLADVLDEVTRRLDGAPSPKGDPQAKGTVEAPWVEPKYRLALDRYLAGDIYGALRAIDAILVLEPRTDQAERLQRLRRRALEKLFQESVLVAEVHAPDAVLTPGSALNATIRLRNLSEETITLRPADLEQVGFCSVCYEELSPDGSRTRLRVEHAIPLEDELVLEPGEHAELPLPVETGLHRHLKGHDVGRYELGGRLRPQTLLVGDTPYALFVPVLPATLLVVQDVDRPLTEDPQASFLKAVEGGLNGSLEPVPAGQQAFVSAIAMARDDPQGTVRALISALQGAEGTLSQALCAALARVTGEPLGFTREEWLLWWRLRRSRPQHEGEGQ